MNDKLYENIKKLRIEKKLSQSKLAELTGYTDRSSIAKIEKGLVDLSQSKIKAFADVFDISPSELMGFKSTKLNTDIESHSKDKGWIPVLGYVAAGIPIEAIEDVLDWEQIDPHLLDSAEYFALEIKGDSMSPRIQEGDIIIVRAQPDIESGEIGVIQVNGDEATCKRICKYKDEIVLRSINPQYPPMAYKISEMSDIPINILGKVVELRRKF